MTTPTFGGAPPANRPHHAPENHWLEMRQEPEKARVVVRGKEKDRKPVDPPPIVQLKVQDPYNDTCSYLHNPYYFCSCTLWDAEQDAPKRPDPSPGAPPPETLQGQLVSSLHRLKDFDNTEQGFFVFSDVSVGLMGKFRLRFSVYEYRPASNDCIFLKSQLSQVFEVVAPKDWDGVRESTALSRSFADQGVRIRLRKESRHSSKRAYNSQQPGPSLAPQTPLRPHPQQAGSYASSSSQDGAAAAAAAGGEPAFKRQRSYPSSAAGPGYMTSTSQGWQQPMYASVPGQPQMAYPPHHGNYYGTTAYSQYQQQPTSQSSSFVSGYPSPSAQGSSQQQYQTPTSRGYAQPQSGYVTAPGGMYGTQQYTNLPAKYPSQSTAYASQQPASAQGPMVGYGTPQSQQAPFAATSAYSGAQQAQQHAQQQRASYPVPSHAAPSAQYGINQSASVAYRPGPPSNAPGQPQPQEEMDEMMRQQGRHMANPSTTPRLNPIHGPGGGGRDLPVQSTETDQQHTPTQMHHAAMQQRRQQGLPPNPGGPGDV